MTLLAFAGGVLLGALGLWLLSRPQLQYLKDELATTQDRLYGAWKEGAVIPTRDQVKTPEPSSRPEPLPDELLALVHDYASPEGQAEAEATIRQKLALGWGMERIASELNRLPD